MEEELIKIPNLEDFIMSFMNLLVLNGVSIPNKVESEKSLFTSIIESEEEFSNVRLVHNEYSCVLEGLNPRMPGHLTLEVKVFCFF
jgi:hypothetical protein